MYDGYHFSPASPDSFNPFSLLNCFSDNKLNAYWFGSGTVGKMTLALVKNDMDCALRLLQTFLSTVPYCDNTNYEDHWQQVLYIIFSLHGNNADVEVHTATGRVDMVMATKTRLYIIETKIDKNAEAAMTQINPNDYAARFDLYNLPRVKVGINFDTEKHTISDWKIEEA